MNPSGTKAAVKDEMEKMRRAERKKEKEGKGKAKAMMEASYEVLGNTASEEEVEVVGEEINGEQLRAEMQSFAKTESIRAGVSAFAFTLACVGLWGDGAH